MSFISLEEFEELAGDGFEDNWVLPYGLLPEIDRAEIDTRYSLGSYDGTMAGMVIYNGEKYFAKSLDDRQKGSNRVFLLVKLSDKIADTFEDYAAYLNEIYAGIHCDPHGNKIYRAECDLNPMAKAVEDPRNTYCDELWEERLVVRYFKGWRYDG